MSSLRITCTKCQGAMKVPQDSPAGKKFRCPTCREIVTLSADDLARTQAVSADSIKLGKPQSKAQLGGEKSALKQAGPPAKTGTLTPVKGDSGSVVLAQPVSMPPQVPERAAGKKADTNGKDDALTQAVTLNLEPPPLEIVEVFDSPTIAPAPLESDTDASLPTVAVVEDEDHDSSSGSFLDLTSDLTAPMPSAGKGAPPPSIPGFEVLSELGRGGMGVVYKAKETKLDRIVAVKMILSGGHASGAELARFVGEAKAIAQLHHANIVQLYGAGQHQGLSYFTLEYVSGGSLARKLAGKPLAPRDAGKLVAQLARGMHYAHQRGIVHRDLKPANVLLAGEVPKITDFGLAKRIEGGSELTASGAIMGTPSYMAPEQADGRKQPITTAADIYSLGAILFECLTGQPPFRADSALDTLMQVLQHEPPRPRKFNKRVDGDLETICLKCLEKEPKKRYGSAEALADDLERWLAGETIQARPAGNLERAWKWSRRRPAVAGMFVVSILAALLLIGLFISSHLEIAQQHAKTKEALEKEQQAVGEKQLALQRTNVALSSLEIEQKKTMELYNQQIDLLKRQERTSYLHAILLAEREIETAYTGRVEELLRSCPDALKRWEWYRLHHLISSEAFTIKQPNVTAMFWSPKGEHLHTISTSQGPETAWPKRTWDAASGLEIPDSEASLDLGLHPPGVAAYRLSPDSKRWIRREDLPEAPAEAVQAAGVIGLLASPDTCSLLPTPSAPSLENLRILPAGPGQEVVLARSSAGQKMQFFEWSPDGQFLVGIDRANNVNAWETATGKQILHFANQTREGVLYRNGSSFARFRWEARGGSLYYGLNNQLASVNFTRVLWSPDSKRFALVCGTYQEGFAQVLDVASGQELLLIHQAEGHDLLKLQWSPNSQHLATLWNYWLVPAGGTAPLVYVKTWKAGTGEEGTRIPIGPQSAGTLLAWNPDGQRIATAQRNYTPAGQMSTEVKIWNVTTGKELAALTGESGAVFQLAFSPDGLRLFTGGDLRSNRVWNAGSGTEICQLEGYGVDLSGQTQPWSADGQYLLGRCKLSKEPLAATLQRVWDSHTGKDVFTPKPREKMFQSVQWSPDGQRLATLEDGIARVWELPLRSTKKNVGGFISPDGLRTAYVEPYPRPLIRLTSSAGPQLAYSGHAGGSVLDVDWSPDGKLLASASEDRTVRISEAGTDKVTATYYGHAAIPVHVHWCGNTQRIMSLAMQDRFAGAAQIKIWDAANGADHGTLRGFVPNGFSWSDRAALSKNGERLATIGFALSSDAKKATPTSAELRVWDPLEVRLVNEFTGFNAQRVSISSSGSRVAALGVDAQSRQSMVKVWDVASGKELGKIPVQSFSQVRLALSGDGKLLAFSQDGMLDFYDAGRVLKTTVPRQTVPNTAQLVWSPDNTHLLVTQDSSRADFGGLATVVILDAITGASTSLNTGKKGTAIYALAWSPDGRSVLATTRETFSTTSPWPIMSFDSSTGSLIRTFSTKHFGVPNAARFSVDGARLATASNDRTLTLWDPGAGKALHTFLGHAGDAPPPDVKSPFAQNTTVDSVRFSPNGEFIASVGRFTTRDKSGFNSYAGRVHIWDARTGKTMLTTQIGPYHTLLWSPAASGRVAVLAPTDAKLGPGRPNLRIFELATGRLLNELAIGGISNALWSPSGKYFVYSTFMPKKGAPAASEVVCVEVGANEKPLAMPLKRALVPFSYIGQTQLDAARYLSFRGDDQQLAIASVDGVKIWDLALRKEVQSVPSADAPIAWSPDGRLIASLKRVAKGKEQVAVQVHDAVTGTHVQESKSPGSAVNLLWSPDSKRLIVARPDFTILVWDPETGLDHFKLKGVGARLAWGPDGRSLMNFGVNDTRVWRASPESK